ncbi:hypothetical protein ADU37_CDS12210 [Thermococcus sp. 2319x1]|nr:hypothetical protein ADU37_CDS12210 [Thermococcus sp. 2319x1]
MAMGFGLTGERVAKTPLSGFFWIPTRMDFQRFPFLWGVALMEP